MARYRKVDVRIWLDEKVRRLTPIQPCGQGLWYYLLTNPHTGNIPGLYRAGEAAIAEDLGWSTKAFRQAFGEVFREGLVKADWSSRVVWIPGAIKYNRPESPNVVRGWSIHWDEIPGCDLKTEAYAFLKAYLEGLGEGFGKAFDEACRQPWCHPSPNQEQEQEQEQETLGGLRVSDLVIEVIAHYRTYHPRSFRLPTSNLREWRKIAGHLRAGYTVAELCSVIDAYERDPWHQGQNDRGKKYDSLELYMRDEEHVRRGLEMAGEPKQQQLLDPVLALHEQIAARGAGAR